MKTLVVVSGGDAPGINIAIACYVASASASGDTVVGASYGIPGVLRGEIEELTVEKMNPLMSVSGTYLTSSREPVLAGEEGKRGFQAAIAEHGIDNVLFFGGDGSLRHIPPIFVELDIPYVGIPTTIDNNVPYTELTLGFDSACNFAYHSIDGILATGHAMPDRLFTVETLGGDSGVLALSIAQGSAAHAVLLPEFDYDEAWLIERIQWAVRTYRFALVIVCEGAKNARTLADSLPTGLGFRVRDVRLGHAQRGAKPSHRDRVLAVSKAELAYAALKGKKNRGIVVVKNGKLLLLESVPITVSPQKPDETLYRSINGLHSS